MQPTQQSIPCWWHRLWIASAGPSPPTRWILRLTIRHAPRLDGRRGPFQRIGGLVQANRRLDGALQGREAVEVGSGHRLLKHDQVELVELAEYIDVGRLYRMRWHQP